MHILDLLQVACMRASFLGDEVWFSLKIYHPSVLPSLSFTVFSLPGHLCTLYTFSSKRDYYLSLRTPNLSVFFMRVCQTVGLENGASTARIMVLDNWGPLDLEREILSLDLTVPADAGPYHSRGSGSAGTNHSH